MNRTLDWVLCSSENGFVSNIVGIYQGPFPLFQAHCPSKKTPFSPSKQERYPSHPFRDLLSCQLVFQLEEQLVPHTKSIHVFLMCRYITPQYTCGHLGATYNYRCHWNPHPRNFERCPMGFGELTQNDRSDCSDCTLLAGEKRGKSRCVIMWELYALSAQRDITSSRVGFRVLWCFFITLEHQLNILVANSAWLHTIL